MKSITKKIVSSALLSSVLFTTACGSTGEVPTLMNFKNTDASAVVAMIDAIPEATLETESAIEAAYAAYSALEDGTQSQVTNIEKLKILRDEVADLYEDTTKRGSRVDRSKILIGTYCLNYWDESHVKEVADCGIDFVAAAGYSPEFMDNLAKYGIGAFVSVGNFGYPMWRGGDRAMGSAPLTPPFDAEHFGTFAEKAKTMDHEAIWGIELVDEPYTEDFWFYNSLTEKIYENHEDYQVYINLFPNYANSSQLGSATYAEHVDEYVKQVNIDYISYDHYMYQHDSGKRVDFNLGMENMRIVADAGRASNKDYWVVVMANSNDPATFTSTDKLRMQANTALAFGYTVINWACWNPGWFYNNIVDASGNKTEQYDKVKLVNSEINTLSPVFMKYKSIDANIIGAKNSECPSFYSNDDNVIDQNVFMNVSMSKEATSSVLCGYFEKRIGEGSAMMFVNITDPMCEEKNSAAVKFKISDPDAVVTEHTSYGSYILTPDADGNYKISVENAEYSFVTVE